jgi:signal peptide peptidase SppA
MHQFAHIIGRVYDTPLAITQDKAQEWDRVIQDRLQGVAPMYTKAQAEEANEARMVAFAESAGGRMTREGYALTEAGVAIIPVHGSLVQRGGFMEAMSGITGYNQIRGSLRAAERNPDVRGIVLDIDSPGGEVAGMFEAAEDIRNASKPTRAIANEKAASAAFLLASAAGKLYSTRTAVLGSLGALMIHADRSKQHEKQGVKYTVIQSGKRKTEGSPLAPLSGDARDVLQARVNEVGEMFAAAVADYRSADESEILATEAAVLTAREAQDIGLVDGVSTLAQVVREFEAELDADASASQPSKVRPRAAVSATSPEGSTMPAEKEEKVNTAAQATTAPAAQSGITAEQLAAATQTASAEARIAERQRVKAILECDEAKGREGLAAHIAHNTDMGADAALAMLKASPKAEDKPGNAFAQAMAQQGNPDVKGETGEQAGSGNAEADEASKIVAFLPKRAAK